MATGFEDSQLQMFTGRWDWSDFPDSDMSDRIVLGTSDSSSGTNFDPEIIMTGSSSGNNGQLSDALLYVLFY